jgi:hypothetical protein
MQRKYKSLKFVGGQACDHSADCTFGMSHKPALTDKLCTSINVTEHNAVSKCSMSP